MADDLSTPLTPPQDTLSGGSAVQTATDPEGKKWQFDNESGNWVKLETGETVSPKVFSQIAGRSGNAARDTVALVQAMRREEAALSAPPRPPAPAPPPMALTTPPTQTATQPPPPPMPLAPPEGARPQGPFPIMPPEEVARVAAQKPVPSTRTPPSPGAIQAYNIQAYSRAIAMGMPQKQAAAIYLPAILAGQVKPMTAGEQARSAQAQASLAERKRQFDLLHPPTGGEAAKPGITKLDDRYSVVQVPGSKAWRLLDNKTGETKGFTPAQAASLLTKITKEEQDNGKSELSGMKDDLTKIVKSGVPAKASAIAPPAKPATTAGVPMVGTVVKGYRFKGGDPSKKENWEKAK